MPRGGRRAGQRGVKYPQRSDLRSGPLTPTAPTGLQYGQHSSLIDSQRQVPMGPAGANAPAPVAPPPAASAPPPVLPGSLGAFDRPTDRPGEPVTAGLPIGPGPGPEVLFHADPTEETLRALYRIDPGNEHIRELLEDYDTGAA